MNILITGGAGFIGSHTADALIAAGHRVRIVDNLQATVHPRGKPDYLPEEAEFIRGDVRDKRVWETAVQNMEAIYHFAAYQDYLPDFSTYMHVNAVSTALLYEVLVERRQPIQKVIVASSQAVMGEGRYRCPACFPSTGTHHFPQIRLEAQLARGQWEHRCPDCHQVLEWMASDESVIGACNPYAISKHGQEQICIQLGKRYSIPSVALRYSIVQGPRQSFYNAYSGAMRIFALSLLCSRPPTIYEDGFQVRDFINIQDVVRANLLVLEHHGANYQVFNVGGQQPWTVLDFYQRMQTLVGRKLNPVLDGSYRYGDTRHIVSDTSRIQSLGWKPLHGIEQSITDYWAYLTGKPDAETILEIAEKRMKTLQVVRKASP